MSATGDKRLDFGADLDVLDPGDDGAATARQAALAIAHATLSATDAETAQHSQEVAELCDAVCDRLSIEGAERAKLLMAARLHDVGKVAVPQEILSKPGPLDDGEWETVRTHTVVGERILNSVPELRLAAPLVRHSHERWDGSGYPDGLAGEEIPLGSRVLLCLDAFHAIRCDRPYRSGRPAREAVEEVRAHAGTQFDPEVVRALEQSVHELRSQPAARRRLSRRALALLIGALIMLAGIAVATGLLPPTSSGSDGEPALQGAPGTGAGEPPGRHRPDGVGRRAVGARERTGKVRDGDGAERLASGGRRPRGGERGGGGNSGGGNSGGGNPARPDFETPVRARGNPTQANGRAVGRPAGPRGGDPPGPAH